jgi:hypothetical protein
VSDAREELPEARFEHLVMQLYTQAAIALGEMPSPMDGSTEVSLPRARFSIDLLGILEAKTRGAREEAETELLTQALQHLRMAWVRRSHEGA